MAAILAGMRVGGWGWGGVLAAGILSALVACTEPPANFSQHPSFREWYAAHPPREAPPTEAERALLARYRPRVFLPAGHEGPIAFYDDYIAQGTLYDAEGRVIADTVTRAILNAHKAEPGVVFAHKPADRPPEVVVLGRIDREPVELPGELTGAEAAAPFTFLTYNLVFRTSGLPAGMPAWQRWPLALVADLEDWHQLDHYTAVTIALTPDRAGRLTPVAAIFQQHNYLRTYLLSAEDGPGRLALPPDGRIAIDVAIDSNELYPHRPGRTLRRAVQFLTPDTAPFLIDGEDPPFLTANDITEPAREIDYALRFLPPSDAFYVFQGWLGERRRLPGRDGPPGADYNTLPAFKSKAAQMLLFRWYEGDAAYLDALAAVFREGRPEAVDLAPFALRFARDWRCPRAGLSICIE
jgi:hypothetical protein